MVPKKDEDLYQSLLHELRRGTIVLTVLSQLQTPQYGYSLVMLLEKKGIPVEAGTLYPLLRRLEKQTLLESSWQTDTSKPRKYYQLSETGKKVYENLRNDWFQMVKNMDELLKG
ncbi:PadR family transcriptional regulator [Fervidibacillus halotolerans]|uniref:PadR family transcriptional regulator n=1 Tax=Fervidibacillus halotolerans TaxID=2980027 RepID=A0A9E8M0K6_9BACI|nr:PadR family transcriptional regulator [Fervidibacillus halotolerans]WAA13152.1 PadR family transcriptional regulator [Fervidibacillus halotolerans]